MKLVIGKKVNQAAIDALLDDIALLDDAEGTFYVGYPGYFIGDDRFVVPATLVSKKYGLILFDIASSEVSSNEEALTKRRDEIFTAIQTKLMNHHDLIRGRSLGVELNILSYLDNIPKYFTNDRDELITTDSFIEIIERQKKFDESYFELLNAAIERVSRIRPKEKRDNAVTNGSYGSKLKIIEEEIANLDTWQNKAAIESPDSPQRIRGLAGSGKTVVLALKAAYLHSQNPEWNIALTFHTQSLYGQFEKLVQRFYYDDNRDDPDYDKLRILHSFGSASKPGLYYEICKAYNVQPKDFGYAKRTYGYSGAFQGVCNELLTIVKASPRILFDAILIDEAQDLPSEFLQLAYYTTDKHRIVWAYDDLQNLSDYQLGSVADIFGKRENGEPLVDLRPEAKQPQKDIILPVCYRNTPWALVTGHALGTGVYRNSNGEKDLSLIQHPDDPDLWKDIGYEVISGSLEHAHPVSLARAASSIPQFFTEMLSPEDAVKFLLFNSAKEQFANVADMILSDINSRELYPHDILVVFPDALDAAKRGAVFAQYLRDRGIKAHVAGTDYSRDVFSVRGSVVISGPYRAKGNEAPMVYVLDSEFCATGFGLIKKRNTLFTAITRSRAWVRICGVGTGMQSLIEEYNALVRASYRLDFTVPTKEQLKLMRTQHRDVTPAEEKEIEKFKEATRNILNKGLELSVLIDSLPPELREKMLQSLQKTSGDGNEF